MHRRVHRTVLALLLLAACSCASSSDYGEPWIYRGPDAHDAGVVDARAAMSGDASSSTPRDAGTSVEPRPDSGAGGSSGASAAGHGSDATVDAAVSDASLAVVPPAPEPVPDCQPSSIAFDTPPPAAPTGLVQIELSAWLQPVGFRERALIQVLDEQYNLDTSYQGELSWQLPEGVELVEATAITDGQAQATFRFLQAGSFQLEASLSNDPRAGRAQLIAYDVQLPVWELAVDPADLDAIYAEPGQSIWVPGVITIEGAPYVTALRLHGGSSRYYRKKSFRFNLDYTVQQLPAYGDKLILRAEYVDKTLLRNWLALRMVRDSTSVPTPRSRFVHFRVNDRYYGIMHNVERVARDMLRSWGKSPSGSLYEADPDLELASPGANLTPLSPDLYPAVYTHQAGNIPYSDLRTLIEETLVLPDAEFRQVVETEIMVDEYIQYLAAMAAIQNHDQVRKNYYLYRDADADQGWLTLPWDLDLTFGHLWSEQNDILDETIVTDADIFVGAKDPDRGEFYNQLTERVLRIPEFRTRFRSLVEEQLDTTMTRTNAETLLHAVIRCATPDIVADSQKRADNAEYEQRITEILDYLDARRTFVGSLPK